MFNLGPMFSAPKTKRIGWGGKTKWKLNGLRFFALLCINQNYLEIIPIMDTQIWSNLDVPSGCCLACCHLQKLLPSKLTGANGSLINEFTLHDEMKIHEWVSTQMWSELLQILEDASIKFVKKRFFFLYGRFWVIKYGQERTSHARFGSYKLPCGVRWTSILFSRFSTHLMCSTRLFFWLYTSKLNFIPSKR